MSPFEQTDFSALLPGEEQESIAGKILAEIASNRRWAELFARSSPALDALIQEALEEDGCGETLPIEQLLD